MEQSNFIDTDSFAKTRVMYIIAVVLATTGGMTYKIIIGTVILIITLIVLITILAIDYLVILPKLRQINDEQKARMKLLTKDDVGNIVDTAFK